MDMTEHTKHAEQAVTRNAENYRQLVETASDAIYLISEEGIVIDTNASACSTLEWSKEELLGKTISDIDPNYSIEEFQKFWEDIPLDKKHIFETIHKKKDGTLLSVEVSGKKSKLGDTIFYHAIARDITARKLVDQELRESEEKYRTLVNGMHDTVWVIDFNGRFIDTNNAATEILGYTREELLSMGPADIDSSLDVTVIKRLIKQIPSDKLQIFETSHSTKNGKQIPVEIQSCVVKYQGEKAILSIARDITDRKRAEAERLKLRKLETVGMLAGGIAHDFNNLLTGVFGNIELAKMFLTPDHEAYKFLESAQQAMGRATNLTKQLLTFAKGGDPIKEVFAISEALTESAQFSLQGSNVKLQINIASGLWEIEADKGQLSQVINNLVINAQQAMPNGGIITLSVSNIETSEGKYVQITVQDEGVGIAPQHLDKIFDPYFTTKRTATGLGLAVTHSIISKHNGTITVDSQLNRGTIFTIRLPAAQATEKITSPKNLLQEINGMLVSAAHILVLDDEEKIRQVLGAMLKRMGHNVSWAINGQEAIAQYRDAYQSGQAYDMVIMDLTISGGMGGQAAAREIIKINPQAKLIVSSGYHTDPVMANYTAYGFQGLVAKPYRFAELKHVVEQVLKA
ncbi:MAG TPA: PAS domain S-box protein [Anaerolineae bacterium]|nr:PAS domain S-box protein [Anaerolineae bacterium]HMR63719.1 PAS domain S-box protein [Anaerolineae bacterium]